MDKHLGKSLHVRPDFVIIGAMKCATSTIHDQLANQPGISMSDPKEPNFFSDEENWEKGFSWYESLFASMPVNDLKGESSTHYTKLPTYPRCADRLHENLPDVKLIYVMRDPIDRIVSQYIHEWSMRVIDEGCSIDEATRSHPMLIEYSKYSMQLEPYIERFGFDAILPVFFERLMADPQKELDRIINLIGYSGKAQWREDEAKNISSERQRRSPLLNRVLDVRLIQAARRTLMPESVRAKIRSRWTMNDRPHLSEESMGYICDLLDPDLKKLGHHLGVDLSCANYKEQVGKCDLGWISRSEAAHGTEQ